MLRDSQRRVARWSLVPATFAARRPGRCGDRDRGRKQGRRDSTPAAPLRKMMLEPGTRASPPAPTRSPTAMGSTRCSTSPPASRWRSCSGSACRRRGSIRARARPTSGARPPTGSRSRSWSSTDEGWWQLLVGESVARLEDDRLLRGNRALRRRRRPPRPAPHARRARRRRPRAGSSGIHTDAARRAPGVRAGRSPAKTSAISADPAAPRLRGRARPLPAARHWRSAASATSASRSRSWSPTTPTWPRTPPASSRSTTTGSRGARPDRRARPTDAPSLWDGRGNEEPSCARPSATSRRPSRAPPTSSPPSFEIGRHTGVPLETRGLVADWDAGREELTVWGAALVTHYHRRVLSALLGMPVTSIHMRRTDAGGNFGVRGDFFPEDFLVPGSARRSAARSSGPRTAASTSSRSITRASRSTGSRWRSTGDGGCSGCATRSGTTRARYIRPTGVVVVRDLDRDDPVALPRAGLRGLDPRRHHQQDAGRPYRAPGRFENTFAREQLLNIAAAELGVDPVELRRANLLADDEIRTSPTCRSAASPSCSTRPLPEAARARRLESSGFDDLAPRGAERCGASGRLVGAGIAIPWTRAGSASTRPPGSMSTRRRRPAADRRRLFGPGDRDGDGADRWRHLTRARRRIQVVHGDTDLIPDGVGSWSSRSTVIGGSAVLKRGRVDQEEALEVGAGAARGDGRRPGARGRHVVHVRGSGDPGVSLGEIAAACDPVSSERRGESPGLGAREIVRGPMMNYPYGVAFCQLEIDPGTGEVDVRRYFVAYEAGRAVNPMLARRADRRRRRAGDRRRPVSRSSTTTRPASRPTFMDYLLPGGFRGPSDSAT